MPLICIQCALKALLGGDAPPRFDETMAEHMTRCHPDDEETARERAELELRISQYVRRNGDLELDR